MERLDSNLGVVDRAVDDDGGNLAEDLGPDAPSPVLGTTQQLAQGVNHPIATPSASGRDRPEFLDLPPVEQQRQPFVEPDIAVPRDREGRRLRVNLREVDLVADELELQVGRVRVRVELCSAKGNRFKAPNKKKLFEPRRSRRARR